jgi:hypothetical protein
MFLTIYLPGHVGLAGLCCAKVGHPPISTETAMNHLNNLEQFG